MCDNVLVRLKRDPLFGFTDDGFLDYLRAALKGRVANVYIYGSFGTPDLNKNSDIDLMIVCRTDTPFVERGNGFADLRRRVPSLEMLVYTPEEFESLTTDPSSGFWRSVTSTMRKVM